jgi:hypothetical protein
MFNDTDMLEYFRKFTLIGISITSEDKNRIAFYCGGHPYLLEMLGYEIVEMFQEKHTVDVDAAARRTEQSLLDHYDHTVKLLQEDGSLNKLLQILFGPVIDAKQTDVDKLLKYGIIKLSAQGIYNGFSEHFHSFLNLIQREVDLWPIWSQTEKTLRILIASKMIELYGDYWIAQLEKTRPKLKIIFEKCRMAQEREVNSFGNRASRNLIDFTYPDDLFAMIFAEWNIFEPVFGRDKTYWKQRSDLLAKIRNPLAHNREEILVEYERMIAEGYCREILSTVKS